MQTPTNSLTESKTLNTELELAPQTEEETATTSSHAHDSSDNAHAVSAPQPETVAEAEAHAVAAEAHTPDLQHQAAPAENTSDATYRTPDVYIQETAPEHSGPAQETSLPADAPSETLHAVTEAEAQHATQAVPAVAPQEAPSEARATAPATATRSDAAASPEEFDFAAALENFDRETAEAAAKLEEVGDSIIPGTVIKIIDKYVVVDVNLKSEGLVPKEQLLDANGEVTVKPGDAIEVVLEREEIEGGYLLSYEKAQRQRVWDKIEEAEKTKTPITGTVAARVKGGLTVDIGIKAFLPGSQVEIRPVRNLDSYIGQPLDVRVIKLNKKRGNVVISRKEILEEQQSSQRNETLAHLEEGGVLTGTVKNLTDYGAFVDLGGLDGLLHITDMSWGRLTHPRDLVQVGDEIQVKVLKFDKEKQRVSLGFKQLTPDPWLDAIERYPVGARVRGKILSVTDYGAFVELEQGIEGLVHVSEMTWSKRMKHPTKIAKPGDEVDVVVLAVNPTDRRISLGMKQLQENPWEHLDGKYPTGATVEGRVRNLTDFGAFIEIEDGIDGLVHVSNLSWTKRVKHPSEILKKGEKIKAVVLGVEPEHRRLSLGIKQLQPDVWETFFAQHRVGDVVHGKVLRSAQFGSFVQIAEGIEGLCHNSEAGDGQAGGRLETGEEHEFKIIKLNPEEKKVGLSLRGVGEEASRAEIEAHKAPAASAKPSGGGKHQPAASSSSSPGTTTLGDLMNWKKAERDEA
jgi:small subunit ribosomal protein S1